MPNQHTAAKDNPTARAIQLRYNHGLSFGQIAKQLNMPRSTIYGRLKPIEKLIKDADLTTLYASGKQEILQATEATLLSDMLSEDKRKKASLNNVAYAFQQVFNARRLESNQSKSNISVNIERRLRRALDLGKQVQAKSSVSEAEEPPTPRLKTSEISTKG